MVKNKMYFLSFMIFLLGILILSYLNYTIGQERQMFIANRLYSTWSVELTEDLEFQQIIEKLPQNSHVFFEHASNENIRTFYQRGNWSPPMTSGYFFNNDTSKYSAVVGEHYVRNGETTIEIEGVVHQIIGIMGAGYPSALDRLVLINTFPSELPIKNIIIDAKNAKNMEAIHDLFNVQERHQEETALDFLDNHALNFAIRQTVILISIVLSFLLGYIHLVFTEKKITALYLIGKSNLTIILRNILELFLLTIGSFVLVFLIDVIFGYQAILLNWHLYALLLILILFAYLANYSLKLAVKFGGELRD